MGLAALSVLTKVQSSGSQIWTARGRFPGLSRHVRDSKLQFAAALEQRRGWECRQCLRTAGRCKAAGMQSANILTHAIPAVAPEPDRRTKTGDCAGRRFLVLLCFATAELEPETAPGSRKTSDVAQTARFQKPELGMCHHSRHACCCCTESG